MEKDTTGKIDSRHVGCGFIFMININTLVYRLVVLTIFYELLSFFSSYFDNSIFAC